MSYAEIYKAHDGWRWRLKADNHEIIATGEAYATKSNAKRAVRRMQTDIEIKEADSGSTV